VPLFKYAVKKSSNGVVDRGYESINVETHLDHTIQWHGNTRILNKQQSLDKSNFTIAPNKNLIQYSGGKTSGGNSTENIFDRLWCWLSGGYTWDYGNNQCLVFVGTGGQTNTLPGTDPTLNTSFTAADVSAATGTTFNGGGVVPLDHFLQILMMALIRD